MVSIAVINKPKQSTTKIMGFTPKYSLDKELKNLIKLSVSPKTETANSKISKVINTGENLNLYFFITYLKAII
jgi:hypothetical protein